MGLKLSPQRLGWQGTADLVYDRWAEKTVLVNSFSQAPLKLQRPLYPEGAEVCHSVLVHTAGGVVTGDRLTVQVKLNPTSQALVTTAAANKLYGSPPAGDQPGGEPFAHQTVDLTLATTSCLEWFPQETIVFNGAKYRQDVRVHLAPDARWCGWEITRFGRSARGERFNQGHWRSHLEVWQGDRPLWLDRQYLVGGSSALDSRNGLNRQAVVGSLALLGCPLTTDQVNALRQLWNHTWPGTMGVTRLQGGLLCRYRGPSSEVARHWLTTVWRYLRPLYLGRSAVVPRVWPSQP